MVKRIITGILLIAFVVAMIILGYGNYIFLDVLIMAFGVLGSVEIFMSFRKSGYKNMPLPLALLTLGIYPLWHYWGNTGLIVAFSVSLAAALVQFTFDKKSINDLFATIMTLAYPWGLLFLAFPLTQRTDGIFALTYVIFVPVGVDSMAYFVGSTVKGKKLCPSISPKKTISGAIGGLLGGMIVSIVFFFVFEYFNVFPEIKRNPFSSDWATSAIIYLAVGLIGGIVCQLGDLAASRIKRAAGIKDFGNIFPGHGGALDRIDSIMFMLAMMTFALQIIYI